MKTSKYSAAQLKTLDTLIDLNQEELTALVDDLAFSIASDKNTDKQLVDQYGREIMEINADCQDAQIEYLLSNGYTGNIVDL